MYAIIRTGGKQYKVQPGDVVRVEKLNQQLGSEFDLTEILAVGGDNVLLGQPLVANAKVTVVVTKQAKAPKVIVFKKKRRQGYRRTQGHRQFFTELFVKSITSPDGKIVNAEAKPKVVDVAAVRDEKLKARKIPTRKEKIAKSAKASKKA
jgi:large subunit ribosomal protein L21